jgi:anti-sigma-K factor RskA
MKNDGMKALSSDQTYQLWALTGDQAKPTAISAGVLGPDPGTIGFHVDGSVLGFAVSVEQSGGAVQPSTPVASATLSA